MPDRSKPLAEWVLASGAPGPGDLPVFPSVAVRLVDLLEHPGAEVAEAASLLSQDQGITAQVLRAANSILYSGAMPVTSVASAVMRLGFRESANVAMAAACRSLYDMEDRAELEIFPEVWNAIWQQSLLAAYGGRLVARELQAGEPEHVFLGALLRNVGSLLVLKLVARGRVRGTLRMEPSQAELAAVVGSLRARVGVGYLKSCGLPDHVLAAAADGEDLAVPAALDPGSLHVLRLVEGLTNVLHVAPFATGELGPVAEASAALFELGAERLDYLVLQLQGLMEQVRELL